MVLINNLGGKMKKHMTVTAFIVKKNSILLHWHEKVKEWLPPGGHIEKNEDPIEALNREILEETGLEVIIIPTNQILNISNLEQIIPPFTIMIEDIDDPKDGKHKHIDLIYFTKITNTINNINVNTKQKWFWVSKEQLLKKSKIFNIQGKKSMPPEDVIKLGIKAIDFIKNEK